MSTSRKIRKNILNNEIEIKWKDMTPAKFERMLNIAKYNERSELQKEFKEKLNILQKGFDDEISAAIRTTTNLLIVEFLYELTDQLGYWNMKYRTEDEKYIKDSAKFRIKEVYNNIFNTIDDYVESNEKLGNSYTEKKNKLEREFDLKF